MTELHVWKLGRKSYEPVWRLQKRLHAARYEQEEPDTLLLVEHEPVYTIGKSGDEDNITGSDEFLKEEGIEIFHIGRGGDVTYHGPGQIVGYPILDLREHKKNVRWYMRSLEDVIMKTLSRYHLEGEREEGLPGVWINGNKICAVGVRISRWVTFHGFAFNLDPNMEHFGGIVPCGIREKGVTSLREETGEDLKREDVETHILRSFMDVYGYENYKIEEMNDLNISSDTDTDVIV